MEKVLLHICCAVCAGSVVQRLRDDGFHIVGYFYNPNIHPQEEYFKRQEAAIEVARILKFELIPGIYDNDNWLSAIKGLEDEPEGGKRCSVCFKMRFEETMKKSMQMNIPKFSSTLTVSPHKNTTVINEIGREASSSRFLAYDFKKQDGFKLAIEFAKRYNLYRQNYCGCVYSFKVESRE
ncbi:MAG: epoxyqueuosine reductase QueH [Candidatus Omnitrophota bacterium]